MAPHSSTFAWKIPWTEEPVRLQSMGLLRVGDDWVTSLSLFTFMHWRRKWQPTPVFLPGESQGRWSLLGCCLWSCTELDVTEATAAAAGLKESSLVAQMLPSICNAGDLGLIWVRKIPWRRKWQPTPVFLPEESHGQRRLAGYSPWGLKESDTTERLTQALMNKGLHIKAALYMCLSVAWGIFSLLHCYNICFQNSLESWQEKKISFYTRVSE